MLACHSSLWSRPGWFVHCFQAPGARSLRAGRAPPPGCDRERPARAARFLLYRAMPKALADWLSERPSSFEAKTPRSMVRARSRVLGGAAPGLAPPVEGRYCQPAGALWNGRRGPLGGQQYSCISLRGCPVVSKLRRPHQVGKEKPGCPRSDLSAGLPPPSGTSRPARRPPHPGLCDEPTKCRGGDKASSSAASCAAAQSAQWRLP